MRLASDIDPAAPLPNPVLNEEGSRAMERYADYKVIRRNGAVVPFEPNKIAVAMMKAFLAVHGTQGAASASVRETVDGLTQAVVRAMVRSRPGGGTFHIEDVQDQVELGLMRGSHHEVARAYVLYRERRAQERAAQKEQQSPAAPEMHVIDGGQRVALDVAALRDRLDRRWRAALRAVIREGQESGEFIDGDAEEVMFVLAALLDGLAPLLAVKAKGVTRERAERVWLAEAARLLGPGFDARPLKRPR